MRVAVTGSTGFIGGHLVDHLLTRGFDVSRVIRGSQGAGNIGWSPAEGELAADAFGQCDAVVHLAGAGIGDHRWTADYKHTLRESRMLGTRLVADTIARMPATARPGVLISASAVGVYGDRGDEVLDEQSLRGRRETDFLVGLCQDWEAATEPAAAAGTRVVTIRSGIVLGTDGGALKKQLPLFKLGLGGRFGSGRHWQSWISIHDELAAIEHLLTSTLAGPVNLTAPNPVTNAGFTKALGAAVHRPAVIPIPAFGPSIIFGREFVHTTLLASQRVVPSALTSDGYEFTHPTLDVALSALLH